MTEQALADPKVIQQARQLSGESRGSSMPFIPVLQVVNNKETKIATIDGKEKSIEVLCDSGFTITEKSDSGEYETKLFSPTLSAVVLKERYEIKSKWKIEPPYFSREFDDFNQTIRAIGMNTKEMLAEGSYKELKEHFKTGEKDIRGNYKKTFDLFLVLYIHLRELGDKKIYRLKTKMTGGNMWFDYKREFGSNDTYVGYETNFPLEKSENGDIEFWQIGYERGKRVNLTEELVLLKEVNQYFRAVDEFTKEEPALDTTELDKEIDKQTPEKPKEEEINIDSIPF